MRNLPLTFDCMYCSQKLVEDFAKFCGLLRIYELYQKNISPEFTHLSLCYEIIVIRHNLRHSIVHTVYTGIVKYAKYYGASCQSLFKNNLI